MNRRETVMAGATGFVVVSALAWTLVARPTIERYRDARDRVEQLHVDLEKANALVKRKSELLGERAAIDRALSQDDALNGVAIQKGAALDAFLEHIRSLTKAAGFEAKELKYVRAEVLDSYAELRFELRARAPLKQIQDFLVRMASSDWYLRAQALQVQPREDGTIEVDFSLVGLASQDALEDADFPGGRRPVHREEGR